MATYTTMEGPQHIAIRELDLRTCHPSTVVDRVGAVPVLKTSAGKFILLMSCVALRCLDPVRAPCRSVTVATTKAYPSHHTFPGLSTRQTAFSLGLLGTSSTFDKKLFSYTAWSSHEY